jgi:hypothetical protein
LLAALLLAGAATGAPRGEYEVKAAFVLNFVSLVSWPAGALDGATPLEVAVLADADRFRSIEDALSGKNVAGHPVRVRRASSLDHVAGAHVVYVTDTSAVGAADVASATRGKNVLLIGEFENFARRGATINFYTEENKVRFEVNPEAAKAAGLQVSSRLLSVARIVEN